MSYVVLALKWRPKDFDEIVGQAHVVTHLKNAIQKNRLAHAYLFSGPRGVGKTSTARILAKAVNCAQGPTVKPCQKCPSCLGIASANSFDVIEIDGASNRGIDEIRALRENVKFAPTQGKFKVYIIDEVHQITAEGFNALLKTLEEPPPFVKFIFATTHPHKVPLTILSRCHRLDFRRISVMETVAQLEKISLAEGIKIDKDVLTVIASSSEGALRDAESVLDQLISFAKDKVSLADVVSMLGVVEQSALFDIAERISKKDALGVLKAFGSIIDEGKDINVFLSGLIEHFRNLMVAKVSKADPQLIDLPKEACDKLLEQSGAFGMEEIFGAFNVLLKAQESAKRMDSARIPLEIALVKLSVGSALSQNKDVVKHKEADVPKRERPGNSQTQSRAPVKEEKTAEVKNAKQAPERHTGQEETGTQNSRISTEEPPQVSIEAVQQAWEGLISNLGKIKMSVATFLNEGELVKVQGNILTISFPGNYAFHKEALEHKENKSLIEKVLADILKVSMRVVFVLSKEDKSAAEKAGEHNPFVKTAMDMFKGRIVNGG